LVGEVEGTMAVGQWNASHVPEDEHVAPLFMCHIPLKNGSVSDNAQISYSISGHMLKLTKS